MMARIKQIINKKMILQPLKQMILMMIREMKRKLTTKMMPRKRVNWICRIQILSKTQQKVNYQMMRKNYPRKRQLKNLSQ